jgi:ElaB/YqjD/DUF883 family membrane-anchored ribosome-binding protein
VNTQELVKEIQKRHHVGLSPTDPIFVTLTLNELLLANYLEQFQAVLEQQQAQIRTELVENVNASLKLSADQSNQVLEAMNGTFEDAGQKIQTLIESTTNAQIQKIQQETQAGVTKVKQASEFIQYTTYACIAAVAFVLGILFKINILH